MDRNIFDAASKKLKKNSKKEEPANKESPISSTPHQQIPPSGDVEDMLRQMREMKKDLESKISELREKGSHVNVDIDMYMGYLHNTSSKAMEGVLKDQEILERRIQEMFNPETCIKKATPSKEKLTQDRKLKTLGARKKNWIPMR